MQPIRITYNQACELLSIKRDALRLLVQQDSTFPRPIKYGTNPQSPMYFDYADLLAWHEKRKPKILHNTNMTFSDQVSTINQDYNYLATQNAFKELNLLYLQAKTQKEIGSFHGKGLNEHKSTMKYLNQKISRYEKDLQLKLWEHINELDSKKQKTK
jgi:predicted DNA-binding transcriptional regulator AlpA